jgi:hypothetical protein
MNNIISHRLLNREFPWPPGTAPDPDVATVSLTGEAV